MAVNACTNTKLEQEATSSAEEQPDVIPLYTGLDGKEFKLEDFKGKAVFLNYWATWCRPCISEMPDIEAARKVLEPEGIEFFVVSDESIEKIENFRQKNNYGFSYLKLNEDFTSQEVYSLPTTIIYKKDGSVGLKKIGAMDWDAPQVLETIRSFN